MKSTADRRPDPSPACPGRDVLVGFDTGNLSDDDMEAVAYHLSTCGGCADEYRGIVHETPADALEEYLRSSPSAPPPSEPGYAAMAAAARAIPIGLLNGDSTTDPPPDATPVPWPSVVGPYTVRRVLGSGGMGVVYEAAHPVLNRPVAVKMIREANLDRADSLARFRTEAEAVARLRHPNVVEVLHFDDWNGLPYLVMEYVPGRSLARTLVARGGTLPPREAAGVVRTVAAAVGYAHGRKVLHRDLKPGNVLVADDGTPKVTDFGLAKLLDDGRDGPTAADTVLGTPSYMAPEQARGDVAGVGPAADVYALGAILYECLTGRPPFRGGNKNQTLQLVLNDPPVRPSEAKPGVPPVLEAICLKCLAKEPGRRYASADALADDLGRWLNAEKTVVRPAGWFGRNRRRVAAAFLVGFVLGGGAVAAVTLDPERPRREVAATLDRGEKATLIGPTGGPRWYRWRAGQDGSWLSVADGAFTVESRKTALVELLPDPRSNWYKVRAEVRHTKSGVFGGGAGVYVAHQVQPGADIQSFQQVAFNDVVWAGELPTRINVPEIQKHPKHPNRVVLSSRLFADRHRSPAVDIDTCKRVGSTFLPAGEDAGQWHVVTLTVGPAGVEGDWDGVPFPDYSDAGCDLSDKVDRLRVKRPDDPAVLALRAVFDPRAGLGLVVETGAAQFRSVTVTPLPGGDQPAP